MPEAKQDEGDLYAHEVMEAFRGQLVSPGGAATLLGVSRKTIHTLGVRGRIRQYIGPVDGRSGPRWVLIPMADLARYAESVGRRFPRGDWADPEDWADRGDQSKHYRP
jgi:hypothetical protein